MAENDSGVGGREVAIVVTPTEQIDFENMSWAEVAEARGHRLRRDEDGSIDHFVTDYGYHNGPGCEICKESWCEHCTSAEDIEVCDRGVQQAEDNRTYREERTLNHAKFLAAVEGKKWEELDSLAQKLFLVDARAGMEFLEESSSDGR